MNQVMKVEVVYIFNPDYHRYNGALFSKWPKYKGNEETFMGCF